MGAGNLLSGSMCIVASFWWFIGETLRNAHRNYTDRAKGEISTRAHKGSKMSAQPVWYACYGARLSKVPIEPIVKVALGVLGVTAEIIVSKITTFGLSGENRELASNHLDTYYAHSVMYGFFGLSGVVDLMMWCNLLPLPPKFDYLVLSLAFWFEGFLFFFHLHGRDELNVRLHTILYILVFVTAVVFLLAAISEQFMNFMGFLKAYLLSLQGSWFFQAAFVLFGANPWKNSPSNVEFLGIVFAFHAMAWFVIHLFFHIVCYRCYIQKQQPSDRLFEESSGEEDDCMTMEER